MIGNLSGEVIFSDGVELILQTASGVGYQIYCHRVLQEGSQVSLYITHVLRENSEELFAFRSLREKKIFELLNSVRGVGPKSAYSLMGNVGANAVIDAIATKSKSVLTKAPGIGPKAASQMILDLGDKIHKFKMYNDLSDDIASLDYDDHDDRGDRSLDDRRIIEEALIACKELGFREDRVIPIAEKIVNLNSINRPEQLVHLVLKEL